jgi:uracil-DNA glycosylase
LRHPADWDHHISEVTGCRLCPRLVAWREEVAAVRRAAYRDWDYWGRPIPPFGDRQAQVLVVGLAPAAHGGNRTGRVFTGDSSADFLFRALHKAGFANQPTSTHKEDGLELNDVFISAVCRCAPPANRPTPEEIRNCLPYLERELGMLPTVRVIVALGQIAFEHSLRLLRTQGHDLPRLKFGHGVAYDLGEGLPWMIGSYHPSRQNTQTGRLTAAMFDDIWHKVIELLDKK